MDSFQVLRCFQTRHWLILMSDELYLSLSTWYSIHALKDKLIYYYALLEILYFCRTLLEGKYNNDITNMIDKTTIVEHIFRSQVQRSQIETER